VADVGCAGILVADTFCGPMAALPRAGELLAIAAMPSKAGGCAANVAINLAKQGFDVDVAGCLGEDGAAGVVTSALASHGIGCGHIVRVENKPTSTTVILLVTGEDRRYIHTFGANAAFTVAHIDRNWAAKLKVFYLGGLLAMPGICIDELCELLAWCRGHGVVTVVDVVAPRESSKVELGQLLPHVDYFTPNDDEATQLTGKTDPIEQLQAFAARGARTVVITRGAAGAIAGKNGEFWRSDIYDMKSVDPSGSGDAFTSGIITGILRGWNLEQTLPYATALGGSATLAIGTTDSVFTTDQATTFVASNPMQIVTGNYARRD
jgi:sugar/nucleoside kinase (ribokinase family)